MSGKQSKALQERSLDGYDVVAFLTDSESFTVEEMVVAICLRPTGKEVLPGVLQTVTESERV